MTKGNFSNQGRDTFDPRKQYIGIRLQQGVPLLDRDWNELEDIRRYFERMLRRHYIGQGVPDDQGFRITAPPFRAPNDFMIGAGRCMVNGYDVHNEKPLLYSEQSGVPRLSPPDQDEVLTVYLQAAVVRVDSSDDPDLRNSQDISLETCVRDRLTWAVRVVRHPEQPPAGTYALAVIRRPAGAANITDAMIEDRRRTGLNLADVVDTADNLKARVAILENRIQHIQLDIEGIKRQLARLFWDVNLQVSQTQAFFGADVQITATVTDGLGQPVNGAYLTFSTDWGSLDPAIAVTDRNGRATIELIGVEAETPPPRADVGILRNVIQKVNLATLSNPGIIQYAQIRFEPQEMALISKYSPPATLADLSRNLPTGPIVAAPRLRTATVTVHVKESDGAIVRGVGSTQVRFGMWVRDWAKTKIVDVVTRVHVGARIGDLMRQGFVAEVFEHQRITAKLPETMQTISDDTQRIFKTSVLTDPNVPDAELTQAGMLGQAIAQEATAAVGLKTNQAVGSQLDQFVADPQLPLDEAGARVARTHIVQESSKIAAGFAQSQKQTFSSGRFGF